MRKNMWVVLTLNGVILALALLVTLCGLASFRPGQAYPVQNSYGETILLWGAGVYAHDSQFKAPIFIGSDLTILAVVLPWAAVTCRRLWKRQDLESRIQNFSAVCLLLYYAASAALGITYNSLHLAYILLLGACFYGAVFQGAFLYRIQCQRPDVCRYRVTRGMHAYLILGGISLFVAWLPDILSSLASGTSLALIEVYTTEITNVLDMGIISPLLFLTLALVKKHCFMGYVLLRMALRVCMGVGIMLPVQTVCQLLAGIVLPLPALITKVGIFVLLAGASFWLERCLRRATVYLE